MVFKRWDVAIVPFPFIDRPADKKRPALVLSSEEFNLGGYTVMAMITTGANSVWLGDIPITDLDSAGLPHDCLIRWKVMTLDNRIIQKRSGSLGATDRANVEASMRKYIVA